MIVYYVLEVVEALDKERYPLGSYLAVDTAGRHFGVRDVRRAKTFPSASEAYDVSATDLRLAVREVALHVRRDIPPANQADPPLGLDPMLYAGTALGEDTLNLILETMKAAGVSKNALARRMGLSYSTTQHYFRPQRAMRLDTVGRIAYALGRKARLTFGD